MSDEIDLDQGSAYIKSFDCGFEAIWNVEIEYTEGTSADAGIALEALFSISGNESSDPADVSFTTETSHGISTETKNWKDDGNDPDYTTEAQNRFSIRCPRNKTGVGKVIVTVKTFDMQ